MIRHKAPVPESEPASSVGQNVCHPASFAWRPAIRNCWRQSPTIPFSTYNVVRVSVDMDVKAPVVSLFLAGLQNTYSIMLWRSHGGGVAFICDLSSPPFCTHLFASSSSTKSSLDSCKQTYVASSQLLEDNAGHVGSWAV